MSTVPLQEVVRHDSLGLLRDAMQCVGSASQTLAALRRLGHKQGETFASVKVIADVACLETRTVERHLDKLVAKKWIKRAPKQRRRTPTYHLAPGIRNNSDFLKFAPLPRWAAKLLFRSWADRAVFAEVLSRYSLVETLMDDRGGIDQDDGIVFDEFGRLQYSTRLLAKNTRLSERQVRTAKASLKAKGLIAIDPAVFWQDELGRCKSLADTISPNLNFQVPEELLDRPAKLSDYRAAEMSDCTNGERVSASPNRAAVLSDTPRKKCRLPPGKNVGYPRQKCRLQ